MSANQKGSATQYTMTSVVALLLTLSFACTNTNLTTNAGRFVETNNQNSGDPDTDPSGTPGLPNYRISSVTIAGTGTPTATVLFNSSTSTGPISESCSVGASGAQTSKPCSCQFSWQQVNATTGSTVVVPRTVQTPVTSVQTAAVACAAPSAYTDAVEVPNGTVIKISIVPSGTNANEFESPPYSYTKSGSTVAGSFQDEEGRAFSNIFRYSCYEQNKRGMDVRSRTFQSTDPASGEKVDILMASQFCVAKASGGGGADTQACPGLGTPQNSAQANYFNLYIRATDRGNVNPGNTRYTCPRVLESLYATGGGGHLLDYWPMDTSFALAMNPSPDFSVGVDGFSKTSLPGDPTSVNSSCFTSPDGGGGDGGGDGGSDSTLVKSCIGFAAKPNPDGTCPFFRLPNGSIKNTYRLRRFIAIYPPTFDSDGKMVAEPQAADTIFVIDRPVAGGSADPLKPYTMRGPKPCPFAYFDHKGQLVNDPAYDGARPGYGATNNPGWNGLNVDGIELPNTDILGQSCSAAIPLLNANKSQFSIGTLNIRNPALKRLPIRPTRAWAPHYEEDTDFQACAPQADPMKDPPLHFAKDSSTGNVSWCAEAYPTQNPYVDELEKRPNGGLDPVPGKVIPYTSHVVKNAQGAACNRTPLIFGNSNPVLPSEVNSDVGAIVPTEYPAAVAASCTLAGTSLVGAARHPASLLVDSVPQVSSCGPGANVADSACNFCSQLTCDRTVVNPGASWTRYPLLARPPQVEEAISADTTYGCTITYDGGGGKTGKRSPTQGCCGPAVRVWTGTRATAGSTPAENAEFNRSGHLEPNVNCLQPAY